MVNLVQWYKDTERKFRCFDPDHTNSTLTRYHSESVFVDIRKPQSMDQIVEAVFRDGFPLVAVDGIGGQKGVFLNWIADVDLFSIVADSGLALTFVVIVDEDKDTVAQTKETIDTIGDKVDWFVVKNHKTVGHTDMWDNSKIRETAIKLGAREIVLPKLTEHLISMLQTNSLPVSEASQSKKIGSLMDRSRCHQYAKKLAASFETHADILTDTPDE